jgi:post-segregation antitoxin (ccd killing protein)
VYVLSGTRLTWTGQFDGHEFDVTAPMDAIASVSAYLKNNYNLVVENYSFGPGFVNVVLNLVTNLDRGASTGSDDGMADIKSNCDDAWTNALASTGGIDNLGLLSSTITLVTVPNDAQGASSDSYASTTSASDFLQNLLPTWLGGSPVTPAQLAARKAAQTQTIQQVQRNAAATGVDVSAAASTAITANTTDQNTLAAQANAAAKASDESSLNTYLWIGGAVVAVVLLAVLAPYISAARS